MPAEILLTSGQRSVTVDADPSSVADDLLHAVEREDVLVEFKIVGPHGSEVYVNPLHVMVVRPA
jgi:hypothetical protein